MKNHAKLPPIILAIFSFCKNELRSKSSARMFVEAQRQIYPKRQLNDNWATLSPSNLVAHTPTPPPRPAWWDEYPTTSVFGSELTPSPTDFSTTSSSTAAPQTPNPTQGPTKNVPMTTTAPFPYPPTTKQPTRSPAKEPDDIVETIMERDGSQYTTCSFVPQFGTSRSEKVDVEYFLYLGEDAGPTDMNSVQSIVDSIQSQVHNTLASTAFNCSDFVNVNHAIVGLSHDGPGSDTVAAKCRINVSRYTNATSCYQIWAQMNVTMWLSGGRRGRRYLQSSLFESRDAFMDLIDWFEVAYRSVASPDRGILKTEFKGFANLDGFDGTVLANPQIGTDPTSAFMGTTYEAEKGGIPFSYGQVAVVVAGLLLTAVVVYVAIRRKRNHNAYVKRLKEIDDLHLEVNDDLTDDPEVVDDASLFQEGNRLPEEYEVQLEDRDHDYRTCAIPTCSACLQRRDPVFVATEKRDFERNLSALQPSKYATISSNVNEEYSVDDIQEL
jgi:hypothetical protein